MYVSAQTPRRCDNLALGLIALSWKVTEISLKKKKNLEKMSEIGHHIPNFCIPFTSNGKSGFSM